MTNYRYITTSAAYKQALQELSVCRRLAIDTETYALPEWGNKGSALDPHTGRISLVIAKGD